MKTTHRQLQWICWTTAMAGGALLLWKGGYSLVWFLPEVVNRTLDSGSTGSPVLPVFLVTLSGFALLAVSQVIALWTISPEKKAVGIVRGALVLAGALLIRRGTSLVIRAFQSLGAGGQGDPEKLNDALSETTLFLYGGLGMLAAAAICGAIGNCGRASSSPKGRVTRWIETAGWAIAFLVLVLQIPAYIGIDSVMAGIPEGAVDPATLAGLISRVLIGTSIWQFSLMITGAAALIAAANLKSPQRAPAEP